MRKLDDLSGGEILPAVVEACRNIASHAGLCFRYADQELETDDAIRLGEVTRQVGFVSRSTRFLKTPGLKEGK